MMQERQTFAKSLLAHGATRKKKAHKQAALIENKENKVMQEGQTFAELLLAKEATRNKKAHALFMVIDDKSCYFIDNVNFF